MREQFQNLFRYDLWANQLILQKLIEEHVSDQKCQLWISHILNAEKIWLDRILHGKTETPVHAVYPYPSCQEMMKDLNGQWQKWLIEGDLERDIFYQNSKGTQFQTRVMDIVSHVINHSTHHRAQIAARLRSLEIPPPATDYIFYVRT